MYAMSVLVRQQLFMFTNLIDAIVMNGRKRAVVHRPVQFAMYPSVGECNGVSFALNF